MTTYNTGADAANTAVRAYLTLLGEKYYGGSFNTGSGTGKKLWSNIKENEFEGKCAYCDEITEKPTIEHLVMFNRESCGLHHPGNTVPCCRDCNKRQWVKGSGYVDWETQLSLTVEIRKEPHLAFQKRKQRIKNHIRKYHYPPLTQDELNAIGALAKSIYNSVKYEIVKGMDLFVEIDKTLIKRRSSK